MYFMLMSNTSHSFLIYPSSTKFCILDVFSICLVKSNKSDALLFFNLWSNATTDPHSLHGSYLVVEGDKWSTTKWVKKPYGCSALGRHNDSTEYTNEGEL